MNPTMQRFRSAVLLAALAILATAGAVRAAETVLVQAGKSMVWKANASDPGLGLTWTTEGFAATGWNSGTYGIGYETGTGAAALLSTTVPSTSNSVYTRTTFTIADVAAVSNVFLGADYDDGIVAWINGVEIYRSGQVPAGTPAWNTPASSHESSNGTSPGYTPLQDVTTKARSAMHNGTNVLAIGVWNTTLPSSDLVLVPRLSINRDAAVTRGPYLQLGAPTQMTVRWRTTTTGDSCVRYGPAPGSLSSITCTPAASTEHSVTVTGLAPATKYFYSVGTSGGALAGNTSDYSFTTSPTAGTPKTSRVWVLGDSGTANSNARAVRDAYLGFTGAGTTDLLLMLGDNAYQNGTDTEYQAAVFDTYPSVLRSTVLWPTLGNHDGVSADSATQSGPYYDMFTLPTGAQAGGFASGTEAYYSFDYGDIHFICLDSYETDRSAGGAMMDWLAADLADTTANWIIAYFHHPPYSKGSHDSDTSSQMIDMREEALPILELGGVDMVLTGHSHSYERSYLLDGHYGVSSTLTAAMKKDAGDGRPDGSGAYEKTGGGPASHDGAVYVVAGSSGQMMSGPLNHPAMYVSLVALGSLVLDFDADTLDATFLDSAGAVRDYFTIVKTSSTPVCGNGQVEGTELCDDGNEVNTDACRNDCTLPLCGDGILDAGEQCDGASVGGATCGGCAGTVSCTASCTLDTSACTNGICSDAETCSSCPLDCRHGGATCGNGICEAGDGENCLTCATDCRGQQGGKPSSRYCCGAPGGVSNVGCSATQCGSCTTSAATSCCGDGACGSGENATNCSRDCGATPVCGDLSCNGTETKCTCAGDCGPPAATETSCTDGVDNDCDALIDCADTAQCSTSQSCQPCRPAGSSCTSSAQCCSANCKGKSGAMTCK
jgi:hypothetical protein